jgi:hypothetical protein
LGSLFGKCPALGRSMVFTDAAAVSKLSVLCSSALFLSNPAL